MKRLRWLLVGAGVLVGCGGGDGGGGGPPTITSVVVSGDSTVFLNGTRQLTATAKSGTTTVTNGVTFEWVSVDTTRAVVSASGLVSGVRLGATDITARAVLNGTPPSVTSSAHPFPVRISPTSVGKSVAAGCVVLDSANDTIPNHACGWSVTGTDSGVVTFSAITAPATRIIARRNGDANIRATAFTSIFAPNFVQVRQAAARVKLHPTTIDSSQILVSDSMRFIDSVFDANDSLLRSPPPSIVWSSTTSSATVDTSGVVHAGAGAGATFIRAVSGSGEDSALVIIVPAANATTLSGNVQPIVSTNCATCHDGVGTSLPGVQDLTNGHSFNSIVNKPAIQSALKRVLPSVPDSSYLVHKIQGTQLVPPANGSRVRMPFGANPLSRSQINTIRNWILQGAKNN